MKIFENIREHEQHIQKDMQEALDAAWATDDPATRAFQKELFPEGKPSVEQFISKMAEHVCSQKCSRGEAKTGGV